LYCARERDAFDAAREELRNLRTASFLYDSARFTFTPPSAATSSNRTTTPIPIAIITTPTGGSSRGNVTYTLIASITSASWGRPIFILVFGLALRNGVNIGARPETPIWISRAMFHLRLHCSFLPHLTFGGRERLPDDS
jgi:hypothetical protein